MQPDASRRLTSQQQAAISTLDRNVAVVAGAGTGKTTVLVRRFVELLAQNPGWPINAVVAITFTNRAADEMRARVRAEFEQRLASASGQEAKRWSALLGQIEAARITTIHGLCTEIVRANAAAAAVDPGFDVLDETQAALLRDDAVTLALEHAVSGGMLIDEERALAANVVARYGETEIRDALRDSALLNADLAPVRSPETLSAEWEAHAERMLNRSAFDSLFYYPPDATDDLIAAQARAANGNLIRLANLSLPLQERLQALEDLTRIRLIGGSAKKWPEVKSAIVELTALRERARRLLERIGQPPSAQDADAAELLEGWHVLIALTRMHYENLKLARSVLDYDDLERLADKVLEHESVRSRYAGTELRHVMIDEFQDTNLRQWAIVRALAPTHHSGSLFIVGDPKQSIYSFRGADVTVFERARAEIVANGGITLYLTETFRTHRPLVDVLNTAFESVLVRPPDSINGDVYVTYDASQRLESSRESAPGVDFIGAFAVTRSSVRGQTAISLEARVIAQRIKTMVRSGLRLVWRGATYQPVRYGDIAIMLRSFRGKVETVEQALADEGVPYITFGGQGFYGRREVRDLMSALRALHNSADELSLAAALHGPLFGLSDADLLVLRQPRSIEAGTDARVIPMYRALMHEAEARRSRSSGYDPVIFSADVLQRLAPMVGRTPVETLLQSLLHETGYMAVLAGLPNGQQMRANVEKLLDRARESGLTALNQFVRYLADMTEAEAKEGGVPLEADDSVRVTTIHSSKGLEYPVVWIADAGNKGGGFDRDTLNIGRELGCRMPKPDQLPKIADRPEAGTLHPYVYERNRALREERDDAESRRLFYVAATRARDALFISGQERSDGSANGWLGMIEACLPRTVLSPVAGSTASNNDESLSDTALPSSDFPLARPLPAAARPRGFQLSAGDIESLSGLTSVANEPIRRRFERRLRHRIYAEESEPVALLTYDAKVGQLSSRRAGLIVHTALRFGYDELLQKDRPKAEALIRAAAWESGVTQPLELEKTVDRVIALLTRFRNSALSKALASCEAVYREIPFTFQRDGHLIHGVIDLLFREPDGTWTLVDFKTDYVNPDSLREKSEIYALQLAVYAEAIALKTGSMPRVILVFLQYPDTPVMFDPNDLRNALERAPLERLVELLQDG